MADKNGTVYTESVPASAVSVKIGDVSEFKPKLEIIKWNGEASLSAEFDVKGEKGIDSSDVGKIIWAGDKKSAEFFPVPEGYEFNIVLKEKPVSNVFEFLLSKSNVEFYFQPPLTEMIGQEGIVSASETEGFDRDGNVICRRPENIVGSYAVYHSAPPLNVKGGTNYKSGKVCHIYRPKAIESGGKETWCDLLIKDNVMSVTVPQKFLDEAIYPVVVDPTFGYTTIGGSEVYYNASGSLGHCGSGLIYAQSGAYGRAIKFSVYGRGTSIDLALYTVVAGLPVTRLSPAVTVSFAGSNQWNDSANVYQTLMNDNSYGLAEGNAQNAYVFFDTGTGTQRSHCATNLPATWTSDGVTAVLYSWYTTYESCPTQQVS
jgi:hypothetical protein